MKIRILRIGVMLLFLFSLGVLLIKTGEDTYAQGAENTLWISGTIQDNQGGVVEGAVITLISATDEEVLSETTSQPNGRYTLVVPENSLNGLEIQIDRPHFKGTTLVISDEIIQSLRSGRSLVIPTITLQRQLSPAFWIATLVFILVLVLIATGVLHNTLAALIGATLLYLVSYLAVSYTHLTLPTN